MSLRGKIILAIVVIMALVACLLTISIWLDVVRRAKLESERVAEITVRYIQDWVIMAGLEKVLSLPPDAPERHALIRTLEMSSFVKNWVIVDETKTPLLHSVTHLPSPEFLRQDTCLVRAFNEHRTIVIGNVAASPIMLDKDRRGAVRMEFEFPHPHWKTTPEGMFGTIFWIMLLGTALLSLNIYILLNRLVLRPLDLLIEASKKVAVGNYSCSIPQIGRFDEVAGLISSFNTMMRELHDYKVNMEKKISDAKSEIEKTQRGLVIAQRLSAMGKLVAGIAHEINNPLGGMINAVQSLESMRKSKGIAMNDGKAAQYLELIKEGLGRIEATVKKVLQFSPRRLEPKFADLSQIISRAVGLVEHQLRQKGVLLETDLGSPPPTVFCDPAEIQQVFLNLFLNSIEAVPVGEGKITVSARTETISADRDEVVIQVIDNGCGIDEKEIDHVFDLFYSTKRDGEGSGLGLSIVHNIIQNHGGRIEIKSKKGQGTTVTITLPISQREHVRET